MTREEMKRYLTEQSETFKAILAGISQINKEKFSDESFYQTSEKNFQDFIIAFSDISVSWELKNGDTITLSFCSLPNPNYTEIETMVITINSDHAISTDIMAEASGHIGGFLSEKINGEMLINIFYAFCKSIEEYMARLSDDLFREMQEAAIVTPAIKNIKKIACRPVQTFINTRARRMLHLVNSLIDDPQIQLNREGYLDIRILKGLN